jgi:hypothetical protein
MLTSLSPLSRTLFHPSHISSPSHIPPFLSFSPFPSHPYQAAYGSGSGGSQAAGRRLQSLISTYAAHTIAANAPFTSRSEAAAASSSEGGSGTELEAEEQGGPPLPPSFAAAADRAAADRATAGSSLHASSSSPGGARRQLRQALGPGDLAASIAPVGCGCPTLSHPLGALNSTASLVTAAAVLPQPSNASLQCTRETPALSDAIVMDALVRRRARPHSTQHTHTHTHTQTTPPHSIPFFSHARLISSLTPRPHPLPPPLPQVYASLRAVQASNTFTQFTLGRISAIQWMPDSGVDHFELVRVHGERGEMEDWSLFRYTCRGQHTCQAFLSSLSVKPLSSPRPLSTATSILSRMHPLTPHPQSPHPPSSHPPPPSQVLGYLRAIVASQRDAYDEFSRICEALQISKDTCSGSIFSFSARGMASALMDL